MKEAAYILVRRLTLLRLAEQLLNEAGVHLKGERQKKLFAALIAVRDEVEIDEATIRVES